MKPLRVAFVMDQQVGLKTQSLNLQRFVADDPSIAPLWVPVDYARPAGLLSRLPGLPGSIKGTLRGVGEIRAGLDGQEWDAALWATWAAKSVPDLVAKKPAFLRMDMTPTQMEAMGAQYGYTKQRARFLGNWKRRATDTIYKKSAHFFPWNEWVARSLLEWGVGVEKITAVSPGVDTELFCPRPSIKPNDGVTRILFVGGDFIRKGGDLLLAWAKGDGADWQASHPWEMHIVTRTVPEIEPVPGVVFHTGIANNSRELVELYQKSDVFVLPTRADCYSLVALEAMACGLPVIITGLGGIPEIITDETGTLLQAEEAGLQRRVSDALNRYIGEDLLRREQSIAARKRAVGVFDTRQGVRTILETIKNFS